MAAAAGEVAPPPGFEAAPTHKDMVREYQRRMWETESERCPGLYGTSFKQDVHRKLMDPSKAYHLIQVAGPGRGDACVDAPHLRLMGTTASLEAAIQRKAELEALTHIATDILPSGVPCLLSSVRCTDPVELAARTKRVLELDAIRRGERETDVNERKAKIAAANLECAAFIRREKIYKGMCQPDPENAEEVALWDEGRAADRARSVDE